MAIMQGKRPIIVFRTHRGVTVRELAERTVAARARDRQNSRSQPRTSRRNWGRECIRTDQLAFGNAAFGGQHRAAATSCHDPSRAEQGEES